MTNTKNKNILGAVVAIIALIIIGLVCVKTVKTSHQQALGYNTLHPETLAEKAVNENQKLANKGKIYYVFYYSPTCSDCKKIQHKIIPALQAKSHERNLLVINAQSKKIMPVLKAGNVTDIPTLQAVYKGRVIYAYSGTKTSNFVTLLKGKTPKGNRKLKAVLPPYTIIQNQFTKTYATQETINTTSIKSM